MIKNKLISFILFCLILFSAMPMFVSASSNSSCVEDWDCTSWDSCRYGERERDCVDLNDCGTTRNKPSEVKYCYDDYSDYRYRSYCDPDNYYGRSHPCYDILRDHMYMGNYYDDYEYQIQQYYDNKYESENNADSDRIQIIPIVYPEDDSDREYNKSFSEEGLALVIIASILGILIITVFVTVLVIAARR